MQALMEAYTLRLATMDDFDEAHRLIEACDIAEIGELDHPIEEHRNDWRITLSHPLNCIWVVTNPSGQMIAIAEHLNRTKIRINGGVWVHPDHLDRGLGSALLRLKEDFAHEQVSIAPDGERVVLRQYVNDANVDATRLLVSEGYAPLRRFWHMVIDLTATPFPPPVIAPGITIRTFDRDRDAQAVYEALEEAFEDHWGHIRVPYEDWEAFHLLREDFDPEQWFIAEEGGEVAGALLGSHDSPEQGWVSILGVRAGWRGRGVGLALLHTSFAAFAQVGKRQVALGVDAESLTGATRLYERAGMHIGWQTTMLEKELRPASEVTNGMAV